MGAEESQVIGQVLPSGALCWQLAVLPARLIIPHAVTGALRGSDEPAGGGVGVGGGDTVDAPAGTGALC